MGLGAISFEHIAKLRRLPCVEVVGLCDAEPTVAAAVAERFDLGPAYTDIATLLTAARPDAVHVLTPPHTHRDLVLRALEADVHVLVEKPIAPSWDDYLVMRDAAAHRGRLLVENYNWRFIDVAREALALWRDGRIGDTVHAEAHFGGVMAGTGGPLVDEDVVHFSHALPGGALRNFVSHPVSLILPFMDAIRGVCAVRRRLDPGGRSDDELRALVAGERTSGVVAVSRHAQPASFVLTVRGTEGAIEADLYNGRLYVDRPGAGAAKFVNGVRHGASYLTGTAKLVIDTLTSRRDHFEGLEALLGGFYTAIREEGASPVSLDEMDAVNRVVADLFSPEHQL